MKKNGITDRRKFLKLMAAGTCGAACHHALRPFGVQAFAADTPGRFPCAVQIFLNGGYSGYSMFPSHNAGAQLKMGSLYRTPAQSTPLHRPEVSMHSAFANLVNEVTLSKLAVVLDVGGLSQAGEYSRSHAEATTTNQDMQMRYNLATSVGIGAAIAQAIGDPFGAISFAGETHFFENGAIQARSIGSLQSGRDGFSGDDYFAYMEGNAKAVAPPPRTAQQQKILNAKRGMEDYIQTLQNLANVQLPVPMPNTNLGNQLGDVARLISARVGNIYSVEQGGHDTHQNQAAQHQTLFTELSNAITAFVQNLKALPGRTHPSLFDEVVLSVNTEFGRTDVNGSAGTDHGLGTSKFLLGGPVNGGMYGDPMTAAQWQNNPRDYIGPELVQFNSGQIWKEIGLGMGLPNIWPDYVGNKYAPLGLISLIG